MVLMSNLNYKRYLEQVSHSKEILIKHLTYFQTFSRHIYDQGRRTDRPTDRPTDRFLFVSSTAGHIYDFHIFIVIYSTISKIMNSRNFFSYVWIFFLINFFSSCMDSICNQRLHIYFRRYKAGENCGSSLFRSKRNAVVMER